MAKSRYGYTAVVGGVAAVGLVLAALSFGGGLDDSADQDALVLAGAVDAALLPIPHPPSIATTTTSMPSGPIAAADRTAFCELAAEYFAARRSARLPGNRQADWETQLGFLSRAASIVAAEAVDPLSGESWRSILLDLSDRQAAMNLELDQVDWDLGAYHDAISSGVVEAPPPHLFADCAATSRAGTSPAGPLELDEIALRAG